MTLLSDNMRGALLMVVAVITITINDAFIKAIGKSISVWQVLFLRGCAVTPILGVLAYLRWPPGVVLTWRDGWLMVARAAVEALAAVFFVTALSRMPLATLTAIMQALPLTITLASAVFLGARVGWRRWLAIGLGFAGVLLIVRPGADGFSAPALLGVATVVCVTARDIFSRMLGPTVPSLAVASVSSAGVMAIGAAGLAVTGWQSVTGPDWLFLGGAVAAILLGYTAGVAAMRVGDLSFVAPFRYMNLVAALILGLVVFREWPLPLTLAGAAVIVATGAYAFWRERRLERGR